MVDYYALPSHDQGAWPGRSEARDLRYPDNARHVQACLHADVCSLMGDNFDPSRFVPYVAMHEFEGLLFSDCDKLARTLGDRRVARSLHEIRADFGTPEEINDSPETAPSRRLTALVPGYQKPLYGNIAALDIGLSTMRRECPLFDDWITRLQNAPAAARIQTE